MTLKIIAKTLFALSLASLSIGCFAAEKYYDNTGKYLGQKDKNGRIYDSTGKYQGQVDIKGRM